MRRLELKWVLIAPVAFFEVPRQAENLGVGLRIYFYAKKITISRSGRDREARARNLFANRNFVVPVLPIFI